MTAADPRAAADRGGADVKFMLLIYNNPAALEAMSADERDEVFADVDKIMAELNETGELLGGEALAPVHRTVRLPKEQLAGYLMVDCETIERAVEIAGRWPDAKRWAMEVRPLMTQSGAEM
jgi:hypothetical protein